jgi:hypothetical protein
MFRYFSCPHCGILIDVVEMNCKIFRCGIYKRDGKQIPPHLSEEECKQLKESIWGCGKPFCYNEEKRIMVVCEYI